MLSSSGFSDGPSSSDGASSSDEVSSPQTSFEAEQSKFWLGVRLGFQQHSGA